MSSTHATDAGGLPATGLPATMQAVANDRYAPPADLAVQTLPLPSPGAGEVLVEVHAAGVDRGVWHLVTGLPWAVRLAGYGIRRPKQPVAGMDLAGRVVAVGPGVERLRAGDEVFGIGQGTYAEYAVAPEAKLAALPAGVSFEQAAAAPTSAITALQAVRDVGRVEAGQHVLVLGASGGVGSFAVQIAKHDGAEVTGVASTAKLDLVRALGADHTVDYTAADPLDGSVRYDCIVDVGGRASLRRLRRALTERGTVVITGGENGNRVTGGAGRQLRGLALSPFVSQRFTTFVSKAQHHDIAAIGDLVASGALRVAVDRSYALEDAPSALDDLAAGRVRGKAVIRVRDDR